MIFILYDKHWFSMFEYLSRHRRVELFSVANEEKKYFECHA